MIKYPILKEEAVIGVTATSSGVPEELHGMIRSACSRMESRGFRVKRGDTLWTQEKAKSAPASVRADEFNEMMADSGIDLIIPPWGGELLVEILDKVDFAGMEEKWILGYSDTSLLLLAVTLMTGMATAHGTNLADLRGEQMDETTARWLDVLKTEEGGSVQQESSSNYQKEWQHENPSPYVFHLTEPTSWKTISGSPERMEGRLLGGCIDVIRHLIGTTYGRVREFQREHLGGDPIVWYFENCEMTTTDLRRTLVHMKMAGWFEGCAGIMFGRSSANTAVGGYTAEDVYRELSAELDVPVIYDIDCGHVPPQVTLINGAYAEIEVRDGKGNIVQHFKA
ncbi:MULTISPECIES: S66 family peptidase [Bacillaceae]|uniref:S66 family peptidase n=1 Tax=Bacillaceae TaxID=186817 RepID=UPI0029643F3A|nr:LD-carboxypeptidase [Bacillus infantis]MDW2878659.1 LD-carboxypeptidase [Bacillus infantis]